MATVTSCCDATIAIGPVHDGKVGPSVTVELGVTTTTGIVPTVKGLPGAGLKVPVPVPSRTVSVLPASNRPPGPPSGLP
jgi:hypothetical protein